MVRYMFATSTRRRKVLTITALAVLSFSAFVAIFAGATIPVVLQRNGLVATSSSKPEITISIYHHDQAFANMGWLASQWLSGKYWTADCYVGCKGITYTVDPTVSIMNRGRDFEQCKVFGSAGTITCTAADIAQYMSVSSSNTVTTTDTACPATVWITNGGSISAGTITAGVAGATVTTTETFTWTATANSGSLGLACIQTEASGGGNIVLYSEGQFGPDTLANTDTLKITWSIART